ncbi:MAG: hypothetical protein ACLGI6_04235 [Gammaproteobacteria bacterium]
MKPFQIALSVLSLGAILGGCATGIPGVVKYRIAPAGDVHQYALACVESSSGNCYIHIDGPEGKVSVETVPTGTTRTLEHAVVGASFCVSSSESGRPTCTANRATFGPAGSVVSVSRT